MEEQNQRETLVCFLLRGHRLFPTPNGDLRYCFLQSCFQEHISFGCIMFCITYLIDNCDIGWIFEITNMIRRASIFKSNLINLILIPSSLLPVLDKRV